MKLDIKKWNADRKQLEAEIKALKIVIKTGVKKGRRWDNATSSIVDCEYVGGTWTEYKDLHNMKHMATSLYTIRAALRNKLHTPSAVMEDALKEAEKYALPEHVMP